MKKVIFLFPKSKLHTVCSNNSDWSCDFNMAAPMRGTHFMSNKRAFSRKLSLSCVNVRHFNDISQKYDSFLQV